MSRKHRPLNKRQVPALRVFFTLSHNQFCVCKAAHHCLNRSPELHTGTEPPVAIGDLVTPRLLRMGPNQNGNLLTGLIDTVHELAKLWVGRSIDTIVNERGF